MSSESKPELETDCRSPSPFAKMCLERDLAGNCPWTYAIMSNSCDMVMLMISQGIDIDTEISTPSEFHFAYMVEHDYFGMFEFFLRKGANIEKTDKFGKNIFHYIAKSANSRKYMFMPLFQAKCRSLAQKK